MIVQLDQPIKPYGSDSTDPLSLHCQEREVIAALLNQPHAVPSTLETMTPMSSLGCLRYTPGLKRAGQNRADPNPTFYAESTFHHLTAPTRVTSLCYVAQLTCRWMDEGYHVVILFLCFRCGIAFSLFRESIMLASHFTSNHKWDGEIWAVKILYWKRKG